MAIVVTPLTFTLRYTPAAHTKLFTGSMTANWSASGGALVSPASGVSTTVDAPNKTQGVVVSAVNGANNGSALLQVYGTWPVQPHYGYEVAIDNKTLYSPAEDGGATYRRKGKIRLSWTLGFNNVPSTDWQAIREFFNWHQKDTPFYYEDLALMESVATLEVPILRLVTADSGPKITVAGIDRYNITIVLKEV